MPRKRNNKVVRKNLAAIRSNISKNVVQNVKVTVQQPKAKSRKGPIRRKNPRADKQPGELLQATNRTSQAPGLSSVYNAPGGTDRTLSAGAISSLLELLKGKSPEPAAPSRGLVADAPRSGGLGDFLADRPPPDTDVHNSPPSTPPQRSSQQTPPTTLTRILTDAERIRRWLLVNAHSIPTTATYRTIPQQMTRVRNIRDINALLRLRAETRDNIRSLGYTENLPLNTTPADFERFDRPTLGEAVGGQRLNFDDYTRDTPYNTPSGQQSSTEVM